MVDTRRFTRGTSIQIDVKCPGSEHPFKLTVKDGTEVTCPECETTIEIEASGADALREVDAAIKGLGRAFRN